MTKRTKPSQTTAKTSDKVAALLPPQTRMSSAGVVEGLPYLRPREIATLKYIYEYLGRRHHYPTRAEIARDIMGSEISGTASLYLKRLYEFGYLIRTNLSTHRNLRLTASGLERLGLEGIAVSQQQLPLNTQ
jgi:RIO-like serine/threonine protein kinase